MVVNHDLLMGKLNLFEETNHLNLINEPFLFIKHDEPNLVTENLVKEPTSFVVHTKLIKAINLIE